MNKNIKIAKELVGIEKMLVSEDTSFSSSSSNTGDDIESMSTDEKLKLLKNNASPEILEKLAEDKEKWVRFAVAMNPNTPAEAFMKLAEDKDDDVRWKVAYNPNTPIDILRKLADDEYGYVRIEVADHPNTPADILKKLAANDEFWKVRAVADRQLRKRGQ